MYIEYDENRLKAALEVIMEKAVSENGAKYSEANSEEFLEFLGQELYRLIRGLEKNIWCDHYATEVAMNVIKIKTIQTTHEYQQLKNLISDVYEYGRPQDGLWPKVRDFVKQQQAWVFQIWNQLK